ncbi:MAG: ABC transporter substrate-binding protein [Planctomycetota bacterium]
MTKTTETKPERTVVLSHPTFTSIPRVENSIVIGLDADMTSGSARSGEAIRRGLELAIRQINEEGGLLGRPVELIVRDNRGNPDRGLGNLKAFSQTRDLLGVFGGKHTPVAMRELEFVHQNEMLYFSPWAAGTKIVDNGYSPNHVFRVSVRDEYAGGFLTRKAIERGGRKIALVLEQTAWGRSNESAMLTAFTEEGIEPVSVEWIHWGNNDLKAPVERLVALDCDTILFVGNPLEGVSLVRAVASLPADERPVIISHWGISGGVFFEQVSHLLGEVDVCFLQTFSFLNPRHPERAKRVETAYLAAYGDRDDPRDIFAPAGTAHAYELMNMIAVAVTAAGSIETQRVLRSLEELRDYRGLIRDYKHPFPPDHHDALDASDFILACFDEHGATIPIGEE